MINSISPIIPNKKIDYIFYKATEALNKLKYLIFQSKKIDPNALNLFIIAQTALNNGNSFLAYNLANSASKLILPDINISNQKNFNSFNTKHEVQNDFQPKKSDKHLYKDVSNDVGVSFTYPSYLTASQSFIAVPAHEAEHVARSVSEAVLNGEQILVTVSYKVRYDPQTGVAYLAGGATRTYKYPKMFKEEIQGTFIDIYV